MGRPTQEQKDSYARCLELLEAAYRDIKAGATSYDVYKNWPDSPSFWGPDYNWNDCTPYAVGHDACGHYARPDVLHLSVKDEPEQ